MAYNKKAHLRENIDAIKISFTLDRERRKATTQEREALAKYSGFGGIKAILNPATTPADALSWTKTDLELFPLVMELQAELRSASKDDKEYKRYFDSLKNSILTAFYTPPQVAGVLAEALHESGITPRRLLDPSVGTGVFTDAFKQISAETETTCFEKDLLTGKILSHLNPDDKVRIEGYENIEEKYFGHYDVISSNIPFGDVAVFDPFFSKHDDPLRHGASRSLHNYFFMKSVDMLSEGGVAAFITSQGVMNSEQNRAVRSWLMDRCDLVSAIRLPNNLFNDSAGTEVGSDLIVLQKHITNTGQSLSQRKKDFIESRKLSNGIPINNTFQAFDRVVHTKAVVDTDPYGKPAMVFTHEGGVSGIAADMGRMLREDFSQHINLERYLKHAPKMEQAAEQQAPILDVNSKSQSVTSDIEYKPTTEDMREFGEYIAESDKRLFDERPPTPGDYGIVEPVTVNEPLHNEKKTTTESFKGTLFDMDAPTIKANPVIDIATSINVQQEQILTLYDLFGFSEEERSQIKRPKRKKSKTKQQPPEWRDLFAGVQPPPETPAEREARLKQEEEERQQRLMPIPFTADLLSHYREGSLISDADNRVGYLRDIKGLQPMFHPLELSSLQRSKASLYIEIRDTYQHLYHNEADRLEANPALREMLNRLYDDFTRRYGNLNDKKNLDFIKMDARGTEILSLERYIGGKAVKADIFNHPVAFNPNEITKADNAREALAASLNKYAGVNIDYMASLTGGTPDDVREELKGVIYFNPLIGGYEIADKFISGNVISKAEEVERFLNRHPGHETAEESLKALREAAPKPIDFDDLDFNFGYV